MKDEATDKVTDATSGESTDASKSSSGIYGTLSHLKDEAITLASAGLEKASHLKDEAVTLASQALEKGKGYVGVGSTSSDSGSTVGHIEVPKDGQTHKVTEVYTMTEKEVGTDEQGHKIIEKQEKWEERLDDGQPKVVKAHTDKYTK